MDGIVEAVENVDRFNKKLLDSDKALLAIVERSQQLSNEFSKVAGFKEFAEAQKKAQRVTEEANEESRKRLTVLTELERAQAAYKKATSEESAEIQKLRIQTAELVKQQKEAAREALGLANNSEAEARTKKQLTAIALAELKIRKETAAALEAEARTKREAAMVLQAETRAKREGITIAQAEERLRKELAVADAAEVRLKKEKVGLTTAEIQQERELANAIAAEAKAKQETIRIAEAETRAKKELANLAAAEAKAARESTNATKAELQLNERREKQVANSLSAYRQFGKQVADAKRQAKDLGAEMVLLEQSFKRGEISKKTYNKELDRLSKEYVEATVKAKGLDLQIKKIDASVGDSQRNVGNYKSAVAGLATSFRGALAAFGVVGGMTMFANVARDSFDTVKELNAQNYALKQVFETENQVAFQKEYLREISERYGLELLGTTEAYTKYSAAVRDSYLEGEKARGIFESFSGAAAKLGLDAEQTTGIFKALEQMISKGKIQAEELRGQLGDRMAGAFKLFADAMGLSTAQLDELLKKGGVIADNVLPKVAERLNEVYSLDQATKIDTVAAAQNRLANEWTGFLDGITGDAEILDAITTVLSTTGDVMEFLLDTILVKGDDGVSILGDLTDMISALVEAVFEIADSLGLLDSETKNTLLSLNGFKNDLTYLQSLLATFTGYIKMVTETVAAFFATMFQENGWAKFLDRMDKASDKLSIVYNKLLKVEAGIKKANKEGSVYEDKPSEYATAWLEARKQKQAYFQLNGKYFDTKTGKNTGKSLDDYIDRDGKLVEKKKTGPTVIDDDDDKDKKKKDRARKKAQRDAERAAEQARKLAYENAKAELEAQKLSLDFMMKAFQVENKLVGEKEVFYSYYYNQKFALLEKERDLEIANAKTAGERKKIQKRYELDELSLQQERNDRIRDMRVRGIENEKALFEGQNRSILDMAIDLNDQLVENEKKRLDNITALEIRALEERLRVNEKTILQKVEEGKELTDAETDFYTQSLERYKQNAESKLTVDRRFSEARYQIQKQQLENERMQQERWFDTDYEARTEYANKLLAIELESLQNLLRDKEITQAEYDARELKNKLEHKQALQDIENEFWETHLGKLGEAFGKESEMQQIANATLAFLRLEKVNMENMTADEIAKIRGRELETLSLFTGAMANLFGQQSGAYKAFMVMQSTIDAFSAAQKAYRNSMANPVNMLLPDGGIVRAKIAYGVALGFGLARVAVIAAQKTPKYKDGTLFAERSTTAITDEEGPELHFDKNWKLKDAGSASGPRFKHVSQGDKILPADISKLIMSASVLQKVENQATSIDYDKMASKMAERYAKVLADQKKEHYVTIDGQLVRIESKGNTRIVYRDADDKPTGQRLQ